MWLTDKDQKEIATIKLLYPDAELLLCHFHCLQAVDRRLLAAKLEVVDIRENFMKLFRSAMYAETEDDFLDAYGHLIQIGKRWKINIQFINLYSLKYILDPIYDKLGDYFKDNWFNCTNSWAMLHRRGLFNLGDNTTNRVERLHAEIKSEIGHKPKKMHVLISSLVNLSRRKLVTRKTGLLKSRKKHSTNIDHPFIEDLKKKYTKEAVRLVQTEFHSTKIQFSATVVIMS